jgi:hypothetical protein
MFRVVWLALAAVVVLWSVSIVLRRQRQRRLIVSLRTTWGLIRERDRDMTAIASYARARVDHAPTDSWLDDRTWEDVNLDEVFALLDRTESVVGQQLLYRRLRSVPVGASLEAFERLVTSMTTDAPLRERARLALTALRDPAGYDLWWIARPDALHSEDWHLLFPLLALSMLAAVVLAFVWPPALLIVAAGAVINISIRAKVAPQLRAVTSAFRQVAPLLSAAGTLVAVDRADVAPITGTLKRDTARLSRLRRIASWVGRDTSAAAAGDIASLVVEYLNLLFCLDANAHYFGARELAARSPELLRVIAAVGDVDAAISIASYRAGTAGWTRPVFRAAGAGTELRGIRHPLLPGAVPNSLSFGPPSGVIITGSNMSGKSTFLRTVGVTAVMAQTINTCVADAYEAPAFVVRSCIGRADDPSTGKSYYLVEVDSVLELVHASEGRAPHLFLFDELFRGTNAIERIAAGEAVLLKLVEPTADGPSPHVVLAATHDHELVDLVNGPYASYHFSDTVGDSGLAFDYQLQPGISRTRNAIALLRLRGAPPSLVEHALARAAALDESRTRRSAEGT